MKRVISYKEATKMNYFRGTKFRQTEELKPRQVKAVFDSFVNDDRLIKVNKSSIVIFYPPKDEYKMTSEKKYVVDLLKTTY